MSASDELVSSFSQPGGGKAGCHRQVEQEDFPPCTAYGASLTGANRRAFVGSIEEGMTQAMREARS